MYKSILLITIKSVVLFLFLFLVSVQPKAQVPAWEGTSLFKEDFGGLNGDPANVEWLLPGSTELTAWEGAHPGIINLTYAVIDNGFPVTSYGIPPLNFSPSSYAVSKILYRIDEGNTNIVGGDLVDMTDHTSTDGSGYFVGINPSGNDDLTAPVILYQKVQNITPGTMLSFTVWLRNLRKWGDGNTPLILRASGTGLDKSINVELTGGQDWAQYGFEFEAGTNNTVTLTIEADAGIESGSGWKRAFAMDDIEIRQKDPFTIISPTEINAISGENAQLQANYQYGAFGNNVIYRWEESTDQTSWTPISGSNGTSTNGTITSSFNVTGNDETKYYRLAVARNTDTGYANAVYSGTITVTYSSILLSETFGGCGATDPFLISSNNTYQIPEYAYVGGDNPAGQPNVYSNTYLITKRIYQNTWNDGGTNWNTSLSDHTAGCDGYFLQSHAVNIIINSAPVAFYKKENVPVTPNTYYSFYVSLANPGDNPVNFRLKAAYNTGATDEGQTGVIQGNTEGNNPQWKRYVFAFRAPAGVSSATFTIEPIPMNEGSTEWSWATVFAMDDISVSLLTPSADIISPESGAQICEGEKMTFTAEYEVTFGSSIYKWQYSTTGSGGWQDITDTNASGTISALAGEITYETQALIPTNTGYYRVLLADASDTGYTNPVESEAIELEVTARSDKNTITIAQSGTCLESGATLTASTTAPTSSPVYMWYLNDNVYATNTNTITPFPNADNVPTSGNFTYNFNVTLQYDALCESEPLAYPMTVTNCRFAEDYKSGPNNYLVKNEVDTYYTIPGYTYAAETLTGNPDLGPLHFIITKRIYQQTWDGGSTDWNTTITDHTGNGGYFFQVHTEPITDATPVEFYKTTEAIAPNSKRTFTVWTNNISRYDYDRIQLKLRVVFEDNTGTQIGEETYSSPVMQGGSTAWQQLGLTFFAPLNSAKAIYTVETDISSDIWDGRHAFVLDDINIERHNPIQIIAPESSIITVLKGTTVDMEGLYALDGNTPTSLVWQKLTNSNWVDMPGSNSTNYTTDPINERSFYRFTVNYADGPKTSASVEVIPVDLENLQKKYFVCPDNMTDGEASSRGYLPSLIRMEVDELYGITYKWYTQQTGGTALPDMDEYAPGSTAGSSSLVSDGNTSTISVLNERSTEGTFQNRTYWVEVCDINGIPITGADRFQVNLEQGFLCGELEAQISTATARRLYRGDFGGTEEGAPDILQTPLTGIDYPQTTDPDNIPQGYYRVAKTTPAASGQWFVMTDHIYDGIANEKHGYLLAVDASEEAGRFYTHHIENLGGCRDIELVFTGWFASPVRESFRY